MPNNSIVITFDDGYQDNYTAFQILNEYKTSATFFLTTNCIDDKEIFWVAEVRFLISQTRLKEFQFSFKGRREMLDLGSSTQREEAISRITKIIKSSTISEGEFIRAQLLSALNDVDSTFKNSPLMLSKKQIEEMILGGMIIGIEKI